MQEQSFSNFAQVAQLAETKAPNLNQDQEAKLRRFLSDGVPFDTAQQIAQGTFQPQILGGGRY